MSDALQTGVAEAFKAPTWDDRWMGVAIDRRQWHFFRQLHARYGIVLAPGDFNAIVQAVRTGKARLIETRQRGGVIYSVRVPSARRKIYILMYGNELVSAWPMERRFRKNRAGSQHLQEIRSD